VTIYVGIVAQHPFAVDSIALYPLYNVDNIVRYPLCRWYCSISIADTIAQYLWTVLRNVHCMLAVLRNIHRIMWAILRGIHYVDSITQYPLRTVLSSICEQYCPMSIVCWQYCAMSTENM
jgi:hypothetical protein